MGMLEKAITSIRFIGLASTLRTIQNAWQRDQVEKLTSQLNKTLPVTEPGEAQNVSFDPETSTLRLQFANHELVVEWFTEDIIRVTWYPGELPPSCVTPEPVLVPAGCSFRSLDDGSVLEKNQIQLICDKDGSILFTVDGVPLRKDLKPKFGDGGWQHTSEYLTKIAIYGTGQRAAPLNLKNGKFTIWNTDPGGSYHPGDDPLYVNIPVYWAVNRNGSCLTYYENTYRGTFSFGEPVTVNFTGGALRYYLMLGTPDEAFKKFIRLSGKPPLAPRWAFGYHQSRWGYESEKDIRYVVDEFQNHELSLDVIHLDIDYMDGFRVFTVNPQRFGNLVEMARQLSSQGTRLVTILDPGVKKDNEYSVYRSGLEAGVFVRKPDGEPVDALVWPGWCVFPDFTAEKARVWWGSQYPALWKLGVDGFWHDMNEPAAFAAWGAPTLPTNSVHDFDGQPGEHRKAHNIYGLLMNRSGYEGLKQQRPNQRPWLLTRSGWSGVQRYAWNWTGDVVSSWEALRTTLPMLLNLSLSGVYYSGSDIGGFSDHPSEELFLRWFQLASFTPFFRTHSAKGLPPREPWRFGERVVKIVRQYQRLRKTLLPYWYTLAYLAHTEGNPLMRPLFWEQPDNPDFWKIDDAFVLGNNLLIAPVLDPGGIEKSVLLPDGTWYDFWDDKRLEGNGPVKLPASLDRLPILVRSGSILPLADNNNLFLHVYPQVRGEDRRHNWLYSDEGDGYTPGRLDEYTVERSSDEIIIKHTIGGDPNFWPYRRTFLHLHGEECLKTWIDGVGIEMESNWIELSEFRQVVISLAEIKS